MNRMLILALVLALALALPCPGAAESAFTPPSQEGLDAATAVVAMHAAAMEGVIGSDYRFSELAGGDSIYVLYTDPVQRNYLMVSLAGEGNSRADMAVIQSYSLHEFRTNALDSLTALSSSFIVEERWPEFVAWRDENAALIEAAAEAGADVELTYYTGDYITCAVSLFHRAEGPMFTALVSWNAPLSAEDIDALMNAEE